MQFSRFTPQNAVVDGSLSLSWESASSFESETVISSFALYNQDEVIRASANINIDNDKFLSEQLKINYSGLEVNIPFIRIDRTAAIAETKAEIWGVFSERPVDIFIRGNAQFNSSTTWIDLFRNFSSLDAVFAVDTARYNTFAASEPFAFNINASKYSNGFALNLNGGPKDMINIQYTPEARGRGAIYAKLSDPSPARLTITGVIDSNNIDAQVPDLHVDMDSLWKFFPPSFVVAFPAGVVTSSFRVAGTLSDPEFYGTAMATDIQILVPEFLPEPIKPVPVTIFLDGTEMSFGPVEAKSGKGRGKASGWFRFDQWIPNIFNIDIQVPQDSPIPFNFDVSGVLANGLVAGKLVLDMENLIFAIKGDMAANDTEISLNASELAALEGGQAFSETSKVSVVTDISIRAGRRVEFFWPSVDLPVLQAYADQGTGIHVTSDAAVHRFTMTGDVKLRGGELFYLERNFYIREGTLFFRENEVQFDPRITARAEIRDQSDVGPVIISMLIDNAPLKSFTPRFVSTPPLSQLEIYSILGQVPQGEGEQRNLATSVAIDSLAQFTVIRRLQRNVRDYLGLDMFSMRTQLLQNVLLQVTGGQLWNNTDDRAYRVGNYFDNSTIFAGKYFGTDLFGEAMIAFKYDENKLTWGGLVLEPEFGLEISNPLFDIRFSMAPLHSENLFIDDVSFSLIWRRTY
ncbi:MAG: translocation/assembly module TamB [Treponema sp.]|jgi:hypothetical protein|nr:translocation/assembly module TamB [Treponema sp.]